MLRLLAPSVGSTTFSRFPPSLGAPSSLVTRGIKYRFGRMNARDGQVGLKPFEVKENGKVIPTKDGAASRLGRWIQRNWKPVPDLGKHGKPRWNRLFDYPRPVPHYVGSKPHYVGRKSAYKCYKPAIYLKGNGDKKKPPRMRTVEAFLLKHGKVRDQIVAALSSELTLQDLLVYKKIKRAADKSVLDRTEEERIEILEAKSVLDRMEGGRKESLERLATLVKKKEKTFKFLREHDVKFDHDRKVFSFQEGGLRKIRHPKEWLYLSERQLKYGLTKKEKDMGKRKLGFMWFFGRKPKFTRRPPPPIIRTDLKEKSDEIITREEQPLVPKKYPPSTMVGKVVSTKMNKTTVVQVHKQHYLSKYRKWVPKFVKYNCHDEDEVCRLDDRVLIVPDRPRSKTKRFSVREILDRRGLVEFGKETSKKFVGDRDYLTYLIDGKVVQGEKKLGQGE